MGNKKRVETAILDEPVFSEVEQIRTEIEELEQQIAEAAEAEQVAKEPEPKPVIEHHVHVNWNKRITEILRKEGRL